MDVRGGGGKIWDAAAVIQLDGGRPIGFSGRGAICVVFLLQGNVTEKSSSLHVHVFCICATDLSFLAECLAIPNELVVWFSPSNPSFGPGSIVAVEYAVPGYES